MRKILLKIKNYIYSFLKKRLKKPNHIQWDGDYGFNGQEGINNKHI